MLCRVLRQDDENDEKWKALAFMATQLAQWFTIPLPMNSRRTLALTCCRKRERSGRWRQSGAVLC
jgi:hypothetical protein